ncbi:uncharacterized protein A1O9_07858 [Exophiala aquamarina CBS 119918]|uniref:Uncharacterized protein n=1 Tax=Exophiala aquamarina CBS 119918 TaxID=1182545 RepID=A0A072P988_9EURO|nr:uncharacterized protein A1O9_07858 [Exophiala aquamarina CBS 119918]KEF56277.1 hypothetical protein A1O9_07858 [Exophiala aquamarina CBS 119918]
MTINESVPQPLECFGIMENRLQENGDHRIEEDRNLNNAGAAVNVRDQYDLSPLFVASRRGYAKIVELLIEAGADLEAQNRDEGSALQVASGAGQEGIVDKLLESGADVNGGGGFYNNPLQAASAQGHASIVQRLITAGADVNKIGGYHGTSLQAASAEGDDHVVRRLLAANAEVNIQGGKHANALVAVSENLKFATRTIMSGASSGLSANFGKYVRIVVLLRDHGANADVPGTQYGDLLYTASYKGNEEAVRLLLETGVNANEQQRGKLDTALQAAAYRGEENIVKLLLDAGVNVNAQGGEFYGNALYAALESYWSDEKTVQILLDHGADVKAGNARHTDALEAASTEGKMDVVQRFLDKEVADRAGEVDSSAGCKRGQSP